MEANKKSTCSAGLRCTQLTHCGPGLPSNNCLVDQSLDVLFACSTLLVGLQQHPCHMRQLCTNTWQLQRLSFLCLLPEALQGQEQILQGKWKCEGVAPSTKPMSSHVRLGVQRLGFLRLLSHIVFIPGFHGHADQSCDTRAGADSFHDGDLLLGEVMRGIARPHVVCQGQCGKFALAQRAFAFVAYGQLAPFT